MPFKRNWDSSCPIVWDTWQDGENTWVIRDLRPEDDEEALRILVEHLCTDETLCVLSKLSEDQESLDSVKPFWRHFLGQRMSLGCYLENNGESKLVALNCCVVKCKGEDNSVPIEGRAWKNVYNALDVVDQKADSFKFLGQDIILYALGLVVSRDYRGHGLGARILRAREPLSLHHCIRGTSTVFTGPASQKSALKAGFTTIATVTLKELKEAGLDYPEDETRNIQLMVKKFDCEVISS